MAAAAMTIVSVSPLSTSSNAFLGRNVDRNTVDIGGRKNERIKSASCKPSASGAESFGHSRLSLGRSTLPNPQSSFHSSTSTSSTINVLTFTTDERSMTQAAASEALNLARAALKAAREAQAYAQIHSFLPCAESHLKKKQSQTNISSRGGLDEEKFSNSDAKEEKKSLSAKNLRSSRKVGNEKKREVMKRRNGGLGSEEMSERRFQAPTAFQKALEKAQLERKVRQEKASPIVSFPGLNGETESLTEASSKVRSTGRSRRRRANTISGSSSRSSILQKISEISGADSSERESLTRGNSSPSSSSRGGNSSIAREGFLLPHLAKARLLTAAEEVELTIEIQDLLHIEKVKADLAAQMGREPSIQEWSKALHITSSELKKREQHGKDCKHAMVMHNMRLVYSIAKKHSGRGVSLEDLIAEGCKGLIRGTEKFDHTKGFKFSTYAHWWIRQAISRAITDQSKTVRLPAHVYETVSRINKARDMLRSEYGRNPTNEEVAELVGISAWKVVDIMRKLIPIASLDSPAYSEGDETLEDIVFDHKQDAQAEESMAAQMLKEDLNNVLHTLQPRERDVLKLRYGLDDGCPRTLEEVGALFRLTRERIRQIETSAIRKLRQPSRNHVLREYVPHAAEEEVEML